MTLCDLMEGIHLHVIPALTADTLSYQVQIWWPRLLKHNTPAFHVHPLLQHVFTLHIQQVHVYKGCDQIYTVCTIM